MDTYKVQFIDTKGALRHRTVKARNMDEAIAKVRQLVGIKYYRLDIVKNLTTNHYHFFS